MQVHASTAIQDDIDHARAVYLGAARTRVVEHCQQQAAALRVVLPAYLQRLSGYSRTQVRRLVSSCGSGKLLVKNHRPLGAHPSIGKDCERRETF